MTQVFVSHSRLDHDETEPLLNDLAAIGLDVWADASLAGGPERWTAILERIRACEVFVYVISANSLASRACRSEFEYAVALERPVLPIALEDVSVHLLPPDLARLQMVRYDPTDRGCALALSRSVLALDQQHPLPHPLPPEPPPPVIYLSQLSTEVDSAEELTSDQQAAVLEALRTCAATGIPSTDIASVLEMLHSRGDLTVTAANEIDELIGQLEYLDSSAAPAPAAATQPPNGIFISYRRADSEADTGRLAADLAAHFGPEVVFRDVDDVPLGADIRASLEKAISKSFAMLLVVGPDWDAARLFDENDWVRIELELAFERSIPIIPVRVRRAELPPPDSVPEPIRKVCRLNAAELEHQSWRRDLEPVITALDSLRRASAALAD